MRTKAKNNRKRTRSTAGAKPGSAKKARTKKIIVTSFAVGAAGILTYFGWQYWKKRKGSKVDDIDAIVKMNSSNKVMPASTLISSYSPPAPTIKTISTIVQPASQSGFPIKKGSKGALVRQLQEALIATYGKTVLPKYGADGDFGSETENALKKAGLPTTIDQSTFHVITSINEVNASAVGKELFLAANAKDFNKAISSLKKLKTIGDYSEANEVFKTLRINGGVRQTIVNGLLNTFSTASQKEKIRFEFLRMGLQYDGKQWSLSGLDGLPLITTQPATVWINGKESVQVPARMVLGNEVSRRLDYTLFENKGKYFLVSTGSVSHL